MIRLQGEFKQSQDELEISRKSLEKFDDDFAEFLTKNNTKGQNGLDFLHSYDFKQILLKTFSQEALEIDQEKLEETAMIVEEKLGLDQKFRTIVMMKMASGWIAEKKMVDLEQAVLYNKNKVLTADYERKVARQQFEKIQSELELFAQ